MTDNSVLDPDAMRLLRENFSDTPDVLSMVMNDFFESVDRLHGQINIALTTGEAEEMARAAHSLKSNCATVGAIGMADAMREIERIGREGEQTGCAELLVRSQQLYSDIRPQLDTLINELSADTKMAPA